MPDQPLSHSQQLAREHRRQMDRIRSQSPTRQLYRSARWQNASKRFLARNPLCRLCENRGLITPAAVTDHVVAHRGNPQLFWDAANWQALCKPCHDAKTVKEDGGFGRRRVADR